MVNDKCRVELGFRKVCSVTVLNGCGGPMGEHGIHADRLLSIHADVVFLSM